MNGFHVFTWGGDKDRRTFRRVWAKRKSSGATLCGAPEDATTLGHEAGVASLRLEHWKSRLCPQCAAALERLKKDGE